MPLLQKAQSFSCNNVLVGKDNVVDWADPVLSGEKSFNNGLDSNLTNFACIDRSLMTLGKSVVSEKNSNISFQSSKKRFDVLEELLSALN